MNKRETGGQVTIQGCEMTVVLPYLPPHAPPSYGARIEGVGFEEFLSLWGNWPGVRGKVSFCSSPRPRSHISVRGELPPHVFKLLLSLRASGPF